MMTPYQKEQIDVLRRIAERGIKLSFENNDFVYLDLFQHLLDEIHYLNIISE